MTGLYPEIEPYEHGMLEVGDGNLVYWETCGNPSGKPAVVLHGGPGRAARRGSGGCSTRPRTASSCSISAGAGAARRTRASPTSTCPPTPRGTWSPTSSGSASTSASSGGSCSAARGGATLALAYAERHPDRVTELVLWGVPTSGRADLDWLFRGGLGRFLPEQWERLLDALPERDGDPVDAFHRLLFDYDAEVRRRAALAWCTWESATPHWPPTDGLDSRFEDPAFALAFARLVTHYARHDAWLEDGALLRDAGALAAIPGVIVNGRFDLQAPLGGALALHRVWPDADLVVVDEAGHAYDHPGITQELVRATDRFAAG